MQNKLRYTSSFPKVLLIRFFSTLSVPPSSVPYISLVTSWSFDLAVINKGNSQKVLSYGCPELHHYIFVSPGWKQKDCGKIFGVWKHGPHTSMNPLGLFFAWFSREWNARSRGLWRIWSHSESLRDAAASSHADVPIFCASAGFFLLL